jgi:AraC-like DNA-binding protein
MGAMLQREILYRLLMSPEGGRLRALAQESGGVGRIAQAIETIRREYDRPLRIETLARTVGMSVSGLHHHFKAVTALSPLQFQKRLRLHEARRLMLGDGLDAASAAFRVGYESPSQFSREYRRLFGAPPAQDTANQRAAGIAA